MISVDVQFDFSKVIAALDDIAQKQIPFATSMALNSTAFDAQGVVRRGLTKRFTLRNNFVEKGILVRKSTKTNLVAVVYSRDDFMVLQETGGPKTPRGSKLAIPATIRKNKKGIIRRGDRPDALKGDKRVFVATINGRTGIFKRVRKGKRLPITMLYALKPRVQVPARFGLEADVKAVVAQRFAGNFAEAMGRALKTARR